MTEKKCEIKCAQYSCRIIGYTALKEEQRLVICTCMRVHEWHRCFCCVTNQPGMAKACVLPACQKPDKLRDTTDSIAVVVMPLNLVAIMESMVKQSCPQAIQTQAMLISESHPFLVIKNSSFTVIKFHFHNSFVLLLPDPSSSKRRVWPHQTINLSSIIIHTNE